MIITLNNTIKIENITDELKAYVKENLVINNPEYAKKVRLGLWLGRTPEVLFLYEKEGTNYILPYGCYTAIKKYISPLDKIVDNCRAWQHIAKNYQIPLYDYQKSAVEAMLKVRTGILQAPAGSGKTQMGIALACKLKLRTLWLTHTLDLVKQSYDRACQYIDKDELGIISQGQVNIGSFMTFATVQTMHNLNLQAYKHKFDCIIVDECHRVTGSPTAITMFSKVLNSLFCERLYGLTATTHRADNTFSATQALIGNVAYAVPQAEVKDKIMQVTIQPIFTTYGLSTNCLNTDGTLSYSKTVNNFAYNIDRTAFIASFLNVDKPSLFLSERVEHLTDLINSLPPKEAKKAVLITGKTKKEEREQALNEMRKASKKYLFATYQLAKEGLDIPCLENLFMCTPVKDYAIVTQAIGRIARTCDGKNNAICYDFIDDSRYTEKCYKLRLATYRKNNCKILSSI